MDDSYRRACHLAHLNLRYGNGDTRHGELQYSYAALSIVLCFSEGIIRAMDISRAAAILGRRGGLAGGRKGGLARARRLAPERLRQIARDGARVRWGGLPETMRPLFWTHPTTFDSLNLAEDLDLVLYQVLAHGDVDQRAWLVDRVGADTVRAWLRKRRGGGVPADRLAEWFERETIRRWQRDNPGAAIWENR